MIFFSIVVPVYNVRSYVHECLKSVDDQCYKNFEVIIVNDGSTDDSLEICQRFIENKPNFKIISQLNQGLSEARNSGVKVARGDYLIFLDSDDYWDNHDFLSLMNECIQKKESDVILFGYKKYFENKNNFIARIHYNYEENLYKIIKEGLFITSAWNKAIKRKFFIDNSLFFIKGIYSEDIDWCYRILCNTNKVIYSGIDAYVYRQRAGSITTTLDFNKVNSYLENIKYCLKYNSENVNFCLDYLAYNYVVLLAYSGCDFHFLRKSSSFKLNVKKLSYLLNYNLMKRVKIVFFINKFLGLNLTSILLGKYLTK